MCLILDLARENARLGKHQLEEAVWLTSHKGEEGRELGKGVVRLDSWAGTQEVPCEIVKETRHRLLVRLGKDCLLSGGRHAKEGQTVYVSKDAVGRIAEQSMQIGR
jgi:hypothetical protein